uniref:EGF like repeats and discoidin domains 3 n=1 Tax=Chelonoidis abingdonii TaxID=106734 RepID=A0A8C0QN10_CHEAB
MQGPTVFTDRLYLQTDCGGHVTKTYCKNFNPPVLVVFIFPFFSFIGCSGPLGIEGGIVSNQQITASSTHRALFGLQKWYPYYARLNKKGLVNAWTAAENDRWPWIQVTDGVMRVTGVITQGAKRIGSPEYIKSYKIAYSNDGKTHSSMLISTLQNGVFHGNVDNNTPYANSFTPPIKSQYIRLYPQVCRRHCTLRMELLGCELSDLYIAPSHSY